MDDVVRRIKALHLNRFVILLIVVSCLIGSIGCSPGSTTLPTDTASAIAVNPGVSSTPVPPASTVQAVQPPTTVPVAMTATPIPAVPTPIPSVAVAANLDQRAVDNSRLGVGGWSTQRVLLSFSVSAFAGEVLIPQVEVVRDDQPFLGKATAVGKPTTASGNSIDAQIPMTGLAPGQYRWQARFEDAATMRDGVWMAFAGGKPAFGIVNSHPTLQQVALTGVAHTVNGVAAVGQADQPSLQWAAASSPPEALDHVAFVADQHAAAPLAVPSGATVVPADRTSLPVGDLGDGQWYLHLWALNKAGQTSVPATVALAVLRTPPSVSNVFFRSWATNPVYQTVPISFDISRAMSVDVTILPDSAATPLRRYHLDRQPADSTVHVAWDGRDDHGQIVPAGTYRFLITVADDAGNQTEALYSGLTITNKVIKVSLSQQSLTAYDGSSVAFTTFVTTGGQELPTQPGQFEVLDKQTPFVFHAPYPKGSPFWFPDIRSDTAMLFDPANANFIHDAPWRSTFGPGTNGPGTPGSPRTGSHGCVELPSGVMAQLYPWTPYGTPVIVTP